MDFPGFRIFSGFWGLLTFGLAVWAAWWSYADAHRRQMTAWLWAAISFLFFPLGFIVYLIARAFSKPKTTT